MLFFKLFDHSTENTKGNSPRFNLGIGKLSSDYQTQLLFEVYFRIPRIILQMFRNLFNLRFDVT